MERPFRILLVEDQESDVELTRLALDSGAIEYQLTVKRTGEAAVDYLLGLLKKDDGELPDLAILDLNLPGISGTEVLKTIKSDEVLRSVPTVVLSTSESKDEIQRVYDLHANAFMSKPSEFDRFAELIDRAVEFWFRAVRLPNTVAG